MQIARKLFICVKQGDKALVSLVATGPDYTGEQDLIARFEASDGTFGKRSRQFLCTQISTSA
jgi:hypothetical protein